MRLSLAPRDARALRLGAIAVVPIVVFQFAIKPYVNAMSTARDELRSQRELLARELRVVEERALYDTLLAESEVVRSSAEERLFVEVDAVAAAAALTRLVRQHASAAPLLIQQIETRDAEPLGDRLFAIDVIVRGESDLEGVLSFIRQLDISERLVTVPSLRVEAVASGEPSANEPAVLSMNITLRGYAMLESPPALSVVPK